MSGQATIASLSNRLTTTSSLLLERSRVLSLNLQPSAASQNQITRNLKAIQSDLARLQDEIGIERSGLVVGKGKGKGKGKGAGAGADGKAESEEEKAVRELGERYDRLVEMLEEDDVGKEKAKGLKRVIERPPPIQTDSGESIANEDGVDTDSSSVDAPKGQSNQIPDLAIVPPTPGINEPFPRPFKDYLDDEDDGEDLPAFGPRDMISQQQVMIDDQDERLTLLSHSINRQSHLSVQIGSELDIHHELLEETDAAMDRTAARMNRAQHRLNRVAQGAKQYGSTITIIVLIIILLLLIIVFKT